MNDKIQELIAEAGFIHYGEDEGFYNIPVPAFNDRMKKFTELIVKECVGVCNGRHHTWRWDDEDDSLSGPRDCANSIKQHFGVQ